ncbi:MAG: ATP-dependent helicase, partial [Thermoleophilia bacterium]|nr:ATP-dependent helicase [Thermoleophilia bacterium]
APEDGDQRWRLEFYLQSNDDRSLLVPACEIWRTGLDNLPFYQRGTQTPQEILLSGLGRASRLFPPLEAGLKSPKPVGLELDAAGAYAFLCEAAPLLEQSGFGVLVPAWWRKPQARPGLKLRIKPKKGSHGTSAGLFGAETIVEFDWELAIGGETISPEEFRNLARLKAPLVRVRGQWVEFKPEYTETLLTFLKQRSKGQMKLSEALRLALTETVDEVDLPVTGVEAEGWLAEALRNLTDSAGDGFKLLAPPDGFNGVLRPYQLRGFSWLAYLSRLGFGACLADDMGLGKTIQFLAYLLSVRSGHADAKPALLVCPMSVVGNWQREIQRFAPSLKVL